jgi:hypothetical protein
LQPAALVSEEGVDETVVETHSMGQAGGVAFDTVG